MANKYIIHGATYCGDGTTSAEAASAGAAGAWNTITYFEGTVPAYGTLAAGDVVYIRSLDAAGAAITRTTSATLGSTAATSGAPITWVIDNGAIWSGINGVISYTASVATNYSVVRASNTVVATAQDGLVFKNTATSPANDNILATVSGAAINCKFDWSAKTNSNNTRITLGDGALLESPHIVIGVTGTSGYYDGLVSHGSFSKVGSTVINPKIEISGWAGGQPMFSAGSSNQARMTIIGGSVTGTGTEASGALLHAQGGNNATSSFSFVGFKFPRTMSVGGVALTASKCDVIGCDSGLGGHHEDAWGYATSRTDNNPPYLNARLPMSTPVGWAWRIYPHSTSMVRPMCLPASKLYTDSSGVRTVTQEILVATDFTVAPNKSNLWIVVDYVDSSGAKVTLSSRDFSGAALDASDALWSATTWGMVSFGKFKFTLTTPSAIQQDSLITVTLMSVKGANSSYCIYFVDPDFTVVA